MPDGSAETVGFCVAHPAMIMLVIMAGNINDLVIVFMKKWGSGLSLLLNDLDSLHAVSRDHAAYIETGSKTAHVQTGCVAADFCRN